MDTCLPQRFVYVDISEARYKSLIKQEWLNSGFLGARYLIQILEAEIVTQGLCSQASYNLLRRW
jgi:hypothetical protein